MAAMKRVAFVVLAAALALLCWLPITQQAGAESARAGLKRALATYASARGVDALISVAQQTEITLQPGGVGAGFGVGQALEPLDDLIEQFSALMQWVLVAFGAQLMLTQLGAHGAVSMSLTIALGVSAVFVWQRRVVPHWLLRIALALVVVRFAVPLYAMAAEGLHQYALADQYQSAQVQLELSRDTVGTPSAIAPPLGSPAEPQRWYERWLPDWVKKAEFPRLPDVASIGARVEQIIERLIDLAVLFLFETVVLPLAFFWFMRAALKAALGRPPGAAPLP